MCRGWFVAALVVGSSMLVGWLCLRAGNETTAALSTPVRPRKIVNSFLHGVLKHVCFLGKRDFFADQLPLS